jgi:chromosomal replication initiation ATPase DnaA
MKKSVFTQYVNIVSKMFGLTPEQMFENTKKRSITEARQLFLFLCVRRQIPMCNIMDWSLEYGREFTYSSIINATRYMERKIVDDRDYIRVIREIESKV